MNMDTNPLEAGLGFFVHADKASCDYWCSITNVRFFMIILIAHQYVLLCVYQAIDIMYIIFDLQVIRSYYELLYIVTSRY